MGDKNRGGQAFELTAKVSVTTKQEGEHFIASCPALDVHTQGQTEEQAMVRLKEALSLFLENCIQRGTLEEVLKDAGFRLVENPESEADPGPYLDIPLPFMTGQNDGEPIPG